MSNSLKEQLAPTPLFGGNASAVEGLYEQYLEDPDCCAAQAGANISSPWVTLTPKIVHSKIREELLAEARTGRRSADGQPGAVPARQ